MPSGMLMVYEKVAIKEDFNAVVYASINHREESGELERQVQSCVQFCLARGWQVTRIVKERSGGPGSKQSKLLKLIGSQPRRLVVLHRSRLARYQFDLIKNLLSQTGCELIVADDSWNAMTGPGAVEDLIEVIALTFRKKYGPKKGQVLLKRLQAIIAASS